MPDEDQRWSFEFKDWSEDQVELELATLQTAVDAAYSAPAVANVETVLLSPPSGTFGAVLFSDRVYPPNGPLRYGLSPKWTLTPLGHHHLSRAYPPNGTE